MTAAGSTSGAAGQLAPKPGANTLVTVLLSSTANDALTGFRLRLGRLTLTNSAGKSVTVFNLTNGVQASEFIHSNSILDPAISVSVPQDVYTSATLTFSNPQFSFITYSGSYIYFNTALHSTQGQFQTANVTLPSPITVSGQSTALVVDSDISQSVLMSGSPQEDNFSSSVAPAFTITALAGSDISSNNSAFNALGQIGSIGTSASGQDSLVLNLPSGTTLTITSDSRTTYQGIGDWSALSPGMFADVDATILPDGTLLATRVEVSDTEARDVVTGPIFNIDPSDGVFNLVGEREQGQDFASGFRSGGMALQFTGNTEFRIYGGFQPPLGLPFTPIFDGTSVAAGQNVAVTSLSIPLSGPYPIATTMTLLPQTANGTVESVSSSNGFEVYDITLAAYDPLANNHSGTTLEVFTSSQTRRMNSVSPKPGQVLRFHGLVFSAQGALEMVADEVNDGVAE